MTNWHEDDRFWEMLEPQLDGEAMRAEAAEQAAQAVKLLGVQPGACILDQCCGTGRHSIELARLGFQVTAIDRTARYLDIGRRRAAGLGLDVEFIESDMRVFERPQAFDGAVNLFTSLGYFEDPAQDVEVLRRLKRSLHPGGRAVLDVAGKEVLARIFTPKDWLEYPDGTLFLSGREVLPGWSAIRNHWIAVRPGGERLEFQFECRVYSGAELEDLARQAGLQPLSLHGGLDGRPYDRSAARLVLVAAA